MDVASKDSAYEGSETESEAEYVQNGMNEEGNGEGEGGGETTDGGVKKAKSAYHYHSTEQFPIMKESFIAEGKSSSMGGITSALSAKWRSMDEEQRSVYEKLAADDSARYQNERAVLDAKFSADQEERRRQNNVTGFTASRMRNSTVESSSHTEVKRTVKRKRVESELQKKDKDTRRRVKKVETDAINVQVSDASLRGCTFM